MLPTIAILLSASLFWVLISLIRYEPTRQKQCPRCEEFRFLERIRRPLPIKVFLVGFASKAYHCRVCGRNFVVFGPG